MFSRAVDKPPPLCALIAINFRAILDNIHVEGEQEKCEKEQWILVRNKLGKASAVVDMQNRELLQLVVSPHLNFQQSFLNHVMRRT